MQRRNGKRKGFVLAALLLIASMLLTACGGGNVKLAEGKINVFTSFYPLYDFTSKIGGSHVHVINLVPAGVDAHEWSPKSRELANIRKAQLFIYNGAGFETWTDDFLKSLNKGTTLQTLEATKGLELIKVAPGSKEAKKDSHGHKHGHNHSHGSKNPEHENTDPHMWISPASAKKMAEAIKNKLIEIDPAHKNDYEDNFKKLDAQFAKLDESFKQAVSAGKRKDIVVSHQAFGYLARDYGLRQVPIMGLSPDAEPTAQDMKQIAEFAKQNNIKYIFFEELVSDKLAKTLANELKIGTLVLNPVEGLTEKQVKSGEDYFSIMAKNADNLKKALSE